MALSGCMHEYNSVNRNYNEEAIVLVKKEPGRYEDSLYVLPKDEYMILRKNHISNNIYEPVMVPLFITEKEINPNSILFCLEKINNFSRTVKIFTLCNESNKTLIEGIVSNMEKPLRQGFIIKDSPDIEFYFSK
jgi:hypothetical protein